MAKGKSLQKHPEIDMIERMIVTGWSPAKINEWLKRTEKVPASANSIKNYRANYIKPRAILSPSIYALKLKQIDVYIDSLQELYNLIEIQKRRLGLALTEEHQSQVALPSTRKELELLKDTIVKTIELEMELGIKEKRPIEVIDKRIDVYDLVTQFEMAKEGWVVPDP